MSSAVASLRIGRPDLIVSLTDPPIVALTAIAAARVSGARFVFLCQDVFPEVARLLEDFSNSKVEALLARISRFTVRRADRIIALGDTMKRRLIETKGAHPDKIRVIHNWADAGAIQPGTKDNAFAREHGIADKFVVMHSGNVGLSQDLGTLLEAADLLREDADVLFAIIGSGASRAGLEAEATRRRLPNVVFLDYQPKGVLSESLGAADIHVVGLKAGLEGFIVPSKLYGIMAAGQPFIAATRAEGSSRPVWTTNGCSSTVRGDCGLNPSTGLAFIGYPTKPSGTARRR